MERYTPHKFEEAVDLNELIGKWKAQYGTKIEQVKKDKEFKKLSKADKEYVEDEFNASGR